QHVGHAGANHALSLDGACCRFEEPVTDRGAIGGPREVGTSPRRAVEQRVQRLSQHCYAGLDQLAGQRAGGVVLGDRHLGLRQDRVSGTPRWVATRLSALSARIAGCAPGEVTMPASWTSSPSNA